MRKFVELYGIMIDILSHGVWWTESQKNNLKDNFSPLDISYIFWKSLMRSVDRPRNASIIEFIVRLIC